MDSRLSQYVLATSRLHSSAPIYEVGPGERIRTIADQQRRALLLVSSIDFGSSLRGRQVYVVGAGVCGLTAAAAARSLGANVTIIERDSHPMGLIRNASGRWIHPNIFEWPLDGWEVRNAGVPFLNWQAGMVDVIWEESWKGDVAELLASDVEHYFDTEASLIAEGEDVIIALNGPRRPRPGVALRLGPRRSEVCILCLGVGGETLPFERHPAWFVPYWEGPPRSHINAKQVHFFGAGDGALRDVVALTLGELSWPRIESALVGDPDLSNLARSRSTELADLRIHEIAEMSDLMVHVEKLLDGLRPLRRESPSLSLASAGGPSGSLLLRVLVAGMLRLGWVSEVPRVKVVGASAGPKLELSFANSRTPLELGDRVLAMCRFGPDWVRPNIETDVLEIAGRREQLSQLAGQGGAITVFGRRPASAAIDIFGEDGLLRCLDPNVRSAVESLSGSTSRVEQS